MNFEKVSEGLVDTIEKLSEKKNDETVTKKRTEAQKAFDIAMNPKGVGATPTPPAAAPAAIKEIKPVKPKETTKLDLTKMPTVGQPMTPEQSKYVKETPGARTHYMKQVNPKWEPPKKQPS